MERIRVVLVDDQTLFVDSLRIVMEKSSGDEIEVVGVAHSGEEAVSLCDETNPDLVLMDIRMPGMNGVEATRIIRERLPGVKVVMLTTYDDEDYIYDAMKVGASGYLLKNVQAEDLLASVRNAVHGTMLISPSIIQALVRRGFDNTKPSEPSTQDAKALIRTLSGREREVLSFAMRAYSNREIAEALFIAEQTVRNHINNIYSKIGVHDRLHLIQYVRSSGIDLQADVL